MINYLQTNWKDILLIVESIIVTASLIVKLTPSQKDDKIVGKLQKILAKLALNKK
jgi:hypothetical protein